MTWTLAFHQNDKAARRDAYANDPEGQLLRRLRLNASSRVLLIGTEGATDPEIYERLTST
jgi:hypothetical protein